VAEGAIAEVAPHQPSKPGSGVKHRNLEPAIGAGDDHVGPWIVPGRGSQQHVVVKPLRTTAIVHRGPEISLAEMRPVE